MNNNTNKTNNNNNNKVNTTTNTGMNMDISTENDDTQPRPKVGEGQEDGLSQDEFSDSLGSSDEFDSELERTLLETNQTTVTETAAAATPAASSGSEVAVKSSEERSFVPVTGQQRKVLLKKWRQHIKSTGAPCTREDYAKWFKNEIDNPKPSKTENARSSKRTRSDGSTPKDSANKRRRETDRPRALLSEIVAMTKMVIVHCNYPENAITIEESEKIKDSLLEALDEEKEMAPNFKEIRHIGGALHISCLDEESKTWIQKVVPKIKPWEAAELKVVLEADLIKFIKAVVYMPFSNLSQDVVLKRLSIQNRGLNTQIWRMVKMNQEKIGQTMIVLIDVKSYEYLKSKNFMAGLNFTQVKFRIPSKDDKKDEKKEASVEVEATESSPMETEPIVQTSSVTQPTAEITAAKTNPQPCTSAAVSEAAAGNNKREKSQHDERSRKSKSRERRAGSEYDDYSHRHRDRYSSSRHKHHSQRRGDSGSRSREGSSVRRKKTPEREIPKGK